MAGTTVRVTFGGCAADVEMDGIDFATLNTETECRRAAAPLVEKAIKALCLAAGKAAWAHDVRMGLVHDKSRNARFKKVREYAAIWLRQKAQMQESLEEFFVGELSRQAEAMRPRIID